MDNGAYLAQLLNASSEERRGRPLGPVEPDEGPEAEKTVQRTIKQLKKHKIAFVEETPDHIGLTYFGTVVGVLGGKIVVGEDGSDSQWLITNGKQFGFSEDPGRIARYILAIEVNVRSGAACVLDKMTRYMADMGVEGKYHRDSLAFKSFMGAKIEAIMYKSLKRGMWIKIQPKHGQTVYRTLRYNRKGSAHAAMNTEKGNNTYIKTAAYLIRDHDLDQLGYKKGDKINYKECGHHNSVAHPNCGCTIRTSVERAA